MDRFAANTALSGLRLAVRITSSRAGLGQESASTKIVMEPCSLFD
jgi:hypothetical protein